MHTPATGLQTVARRDMSGGPGAPAGQGPNVEGFDQTASGFVGVAGLPDLERCCALARRVLAAEGVGAGQLDLILVDPDDMAELNETHMGHEGPTDVLSFPMDADEVERHAQQGLADGGSTNAEGPPLHLGDPPLHLGDPPLHLGDPPLHLGDPPLHLGDPPLHLGDIVLCPAVAERQAPDHCGTVEAELSLLIIHGVLHILGHDHAEPEETLAMQARERHHLADLGFGHPVAT